MSFFRKKRNMVRTAALPDFYNDSFATGGCDDSEYTTGRIIFDNICLYNNATDGSLFYVYGLTIAEDSGYAARIGQIQGSIGTLQQNCQAVRFTLANPPGQIFLDAHHYASTPSFNDPGLPAGAIQLSVVGVGTSAALFLCAPYPLWIVDPGYSLIVHNIAPCQNFAAGFWFLVAKPS